MKRVWLEAFSKGARARQPKARSEAPRDMFLRLTVPARHATCPRSSDEAIRLSVIRRRCQLLAADSQSGCCPECPRFRCPASPGLAPCDRPVLTTLHLGDVKDTPGEEQRDYRTRISSSVCSLCLARYHLRATNAPLSEWDIGSRSWGENGSGSRRMPGKRRSPPAWAGALYTRSQRIRVSLRKVKTILDFTKKGGKESEIT